MATGNPYIKVGGSWKQVSSAFVKVSGSWRPIVTGWVKIGGTWRQFFQGIISDLFNRSNTASGLGTSDTGNAWSALRGNWYINNNKAKSGDTPSAYPIASLISPTSSPTISLDVDTSGGVGIAFWVTDAQNWWGLFPYTNIVTSYSQVCATYSQTGPTYSCGGTYSQSGASYYCGGTYSQSGASYYCGGSYSQSGASYYCGGSYYQNYDGYYCGGSYSQTGPNYYCGSVVGPSYSYGCSLSYGPEYSATCAVWYVRYDGFRGYYNAACSSYQQYGPYYGCINYTTVGPTYSCNQTNGPYYGSSCSNTQGPNYSSACSNTVGPNYSSVCSNTVGPNYYQVCSNPVGPNYSQVCSNPVGPNYSSSCATYSSSSSTSAGTQALRLIKSVANTVTTVVDQALSSLPASLKLKVAGGTITGQAFASAGQVTQIGTDLTNTPTSPATSVTHGIILAPGGYTQGTTVDNLTISV